jgi:hypothetical protein
MEDELEQLRRELHDLRVRGALPDRINVDPEGLEQGLAQLVLTLIEFLRQVLERQAVRRMEGGSLSDEEVEQVGLALMKLEEKVHPRRTVRAAAKRPEHQTRSPRRSPVTLEPRRGYQGTNLVDVLDRILDKGLVVAGDVRISLANVELLTSAFDSWCARSTRPNRFNPICSD